MSRPGTAASRPRTAASTREEVGSNIVIALRVSGSRVCAASMDYDAPTAVDLVSWEDDRLFTEALGFLEALAPAAIVYPKEQLEGPCFSRVAERWGAGALVALPRKAFDERAGRARAAELGVGGDGGGGGEQPQPDLRLSDKK